MAKGRGTCIAVRGVILKASLPALIVLLLMDRVSISAPLPRPAKLQWPATINLLLLTLIPTGRQENPARRELVPKEWLEKARLL